MNELSFAKEISFSLVSWRHTIVALDDLRVSLTKAHFVGSPKLRTFQLKIESLPIFIIIEANPMTTEKRVNQG
jgi:hypothetical protein